MEKVTEQELETLTAELERAIEWRRECTKKVALFEPDPEHYEQSFCDYINEEYESTHGQLRICGITLTPATVLRECDPIAYDEMLNNYTYVTYIRNPRSDGDYIQLMDDLELALADYLKAAENFERAKLQAI